MVSKGKEMPQSLLALQPLGPLVRMSVLPGPPVLWLSIERDQPAGHTKIY